MASMSAPQTVAQLDLDLRNPSVGEQLDVQSTVGIEAVLMGEAVLQDAYCTLDFPALDVYSANIPKRSAFSSVEPCR